MATKAATKKVSKATAAGQAKSVRKAHAASGRPVSPTDDPTDHSMSASEISGQTDPKGRSGATVNAESIDRLSAKMDENEAADQAEVDNSIVGKIRRSELYAVNDHPNGGGWMVAISPQNDPNASPASKRLSSVQPLDTFAPKTGMQVRPKDGDAFVIGEGFGPDATPADWAKVVRPDGKPLFS